MFKKTLLVAMLFLFVVMLYAPFADAAMKVDYGAAFRLRQENWDDVVNFSLNTSGGGADRNYFRLRTQLWVKANVADNMGFYTRIVNEAKYFDGPFTAYKTNPSRDRFDPDEIDIDSLYFEAKDLGGMVDLKIGRQDFLGPDMFGEGFLLLDGTPGDGSKTFYFNAAKARVKFNKSHSIELVYINDPKTDVYLPSLHPAVTGALFVNNKKLLTASREEAFVVYGRSKVNENLLIEPYYIHKNENALSATAGKLELNTVGARVVANAGGWRFGGEYGYQFGDYANGTDRTGNGGYAFVGRKYDNAYLKPEFDLRYVYLSGDDSGTASKNETWNPLFSRAPMWNELLIYSMPNEHGAIGGGIPGYWANIEIVKASLKMNFTPATNLNLAFQYLWSPEKSNVTTGAGAAVLSNTGTSRGYLPTAILNHSFSKNVDGMVQLEYFIPGSFYKGNADNASFFRWQLQVRI